MSKKDSDRHCCVQQPLHMRNETITFFGVDEAKNSLITVYQLRTKMKSFTI